MASYEHSLKNEGKSGLSKVLNQRGGVGDEEPDMVDSRPANRNLLDKSLNKTSCFNSHADLNIAAGAA